MNREAFLQAVAPKSETVTIDGWGGEFTFREFSALDRLRLKDEYEKAEGTETTKGIVAMARAVIKSAVNPDGSPFFTDADFPLLVQKSEPLQQAWEVVARINGLSEGN